jgi:glycosyltransferase involved in cell wall biosynthesis
MAELAKRLEGKVVVSFVGSFGHVYELGLVCEAAKALEGEGIDRLHFVLAGDGEQAKAVAVAAGSLGNLSAPGWLTAGEADHLLRMSHVGLAPIRQNPGCVPNKIFEYAAAGLPILSSLEGETAGILSRYGSGITYPPGEIAALVDALKRLAGDAALRRELAGNAAAMFQREFLASRIYGAYADHVETLARTAAH